MAQRWFMLVLAAVAITAATTEAATSHVVGGSTGWTIPSSSSFYSQWASPQKFAVGDSLVFNFTTGIHNVVEVPKASYDSCSSSNQVGSTLTASPATVALTKPGSHYFICGVSGHCSIGQKLAVTVAPAASPPRRAPAPAKPAAAPVPAPATSAVAPAPAKLAGAPGPAPASSAVAPATPAGAPGPAPASSAVAPATAPAASPTAPAAGGPAGPPTPGSRSGPTAGPTPSADNQNPTAVAGPAGGGPGTSSATSLSLSVGIAAVLSATAAFLL